MTTDQQKLQELFDAALRSMEAPAPKPLQETRENMFPPPPWRPQEGAPAKEQIPQQEDNKS